MTDRFQQIHHTPVFDHDSFRLTCRARGVNHIRQTLRRRGVAKILGTLLGDPLPLAIEANGIHVTRKQLWQFFLVRQHDRHPGILDHERDPFRRVRGIEWYIGSASFENP